MWYTDALSAPRSVSAGFYAKGKFYVIGGAGNSGTPSDVVDEFDLQEKCNASVSKTNLDVSYYGSAAATSDYLVRVNGRCPSSSSSSSFVSPAPTLPGVPTVSVRTPPAFRFFVLCGDFA